MFFRILYMTFLSIFVYGFPLDQKIVPVLSLDEHKWYNFYRINVCFHMVYVFSLREFRQVMHTHTHTCTVSFTGLYCQRDL